MGSAEAKMGSDGVGRSPGGCLPGDGLSGEFCDDAGAAGGALDLLKSVAGKTVGGGGGLVELRGMSPRGKLEG